MKNPAIPASGSHARRGAGAKHGLPHPPSTLGPLSDGEMDPDPAFKEGAHDTIDPDLRHHLISEAAYARYAGRGFEDGFDLDDWFAAEDQIDHMLLPHSSTAT
jgi:hypothetical protein